MSIAAYKTTIRESETPRQIERRLLVRVTATLDASAREYDSAEAGFARVTLLTSALREALSDNVAIWQALKSDLANPGNALPADLRAMLISLSLWVERQTNVVIGGGVGIQDLVQVNRNIIAGLSGQAPSGPGATAPGAVAGQGTDSTASI